MVREVLLDGGNQVPHPAKDPAPQAPSGQLAEPPFNEIQPGTAGGNEVDMEPGMAREPPQDPRMCMRGVIVHDEVHRLGRWGLLFEQL